MSQANPPSDDTRVIPVVEEILDVQTTPRRNRKRAHHQTRA